MNEQEMLKVNNDYDVDQIQELKGLEPVRKRPGMYIGSTSQTGIDQLIYEVIDNSFDEAMAGFGKHIQIHVKKDCSVNVKDEARGIPVGKHASWKNPDGTPMDTLTGILTKLHAGGKFGGKGSGYKCFVSNSPVITSNGIKMISDINVHDKVYGAENRSEEVTEVFEYDYDGEVNSIELTNDKVIEAINGHYILIQRDGNLYWETIENIKPSDKLVELEETDDIEELKEIIPVYNVVKYLGGDK